MKKILVPPSFKISQAMKKLIDTGEKCLIVTNKKKKLLGTITDGDIRRGILRGMSIGGSIKNLYRKEPKVLVKGKYTIKNARNLLRYYKQNLLPIIDKNKLVVGYFTWQHAFGNGDNPKNLLQTPVVIMAGGKGDRLMPFTQVLPKPLIPINNKTVIEHIIEKFTSFGVRKFFMTVNYKSLILKSFFKELQPNYLINFFDETKPLGTIGGLKSHKSKFKESFFVTNCDIIIDINYEDLYNFHKENKNDITLVASTKDFEIPYGICDVAKNGELLKINEKPKQNFLANTGLYVIKPKTLDLIPNNKFFHMTQLIHQAKKKKMRIGVYPISEDKWIDVGHWSEYKKIFNKI